MQRGLVELLMILGGNPVYTAPADLSFKEALQKVPFRIHHGLVLDETSYQCHWHLPEAHYIEAWSDGQTYDGTASIAQPLIEPMYQGRSIHEVVAMLTDLRETPGREIVRRYWRTQWEQWHQKESFEQFWKTALHDGVISDTAFQPKTVKLRDDSQKQLAPLSSGEDAGVKSAAGKTGRHPNPRQDEPCTDFEIVFQPDPTIFDGSWANNGWLQELPKPITKLTWGNAAIMSPATAEQLGVVPGSYATLLTPEARRSLAHTIFERQQLEEQYEDLDQQHQAASLGCGRFWPPRSCSSAPCFSPWAFIATFMPKPLRRPASGSIGLSAASTRSFFS
jgi:anaerobic selenocysteine-containing dehydrogenase